MTQETKHIETIFKQAFEHHEVQPPHTLWETVEASLDNSKNVETLFASAFKNARISPAASVWKRISQALFWRGFLNFNSNSFNIYYLGAALSICGITLYSVFPPQQNNSNTKIAAVANEVVEQKNNAENTETQANIQTQVNTEAQVTNLRQQEIDVRQQNKNLSTIQKLHRSEHSAEKAAGIVAFSPAEKNAAQSNVMPAQAGISSNFNFANVHIVGNSTICANSPVEYSIEGLPANATVDWKLPQSASSKFISTRKISAKFGTEGSFTLGANVKVGAETKKIELAVQVEEANTPEIKGRRTVCEGVEKELYSVDEAINKEITYQWELQRNTIVPTGNKYVNVNWNTAGKDTLTVTRVNLATGCVSKNSTAVLVEAKPQVDFQMAAISTNEYEFWFVGEPKKIKSFNWVVDGAQYSGETFVHTNFGAQTNLVKLEVTNKAGCKNSIQKEVAFGRNVLFVPKTFNLSSGTGFIPQTNTRLKSYTIEIYNSQSEKIWSSSELIDGKPAKAWNGMYKNAPVGKGKYMWNISATFDDGTEWHGIRQKDGKMQPTGIFVIEK
ncbi:MAG: hypothetical protein FWC39_05065 [Bacteroidetes bacterium]|nr:hypothetical protein [Bacteroidota bacterium]